MPCIAETLSAEPTQNKVPNKRSVKPTDVENSCISWRKNNNSLFHSSVQQGPSSQMTSCYHRAFTVYLSLRWVKSQHGSNVKTKGTWMVYIFLIYVLSFMAPFPPNTPRFPTLQDTFFPLYMTLQPPNCISRVLHSSSKLKLKTPSPQCILGNVHGWMHLGKVRAVSKALELSQVFSHMQSWGLFP